ncbi:MAG: Eco57I restriction-modification methylase domain-containing protein, partial [Acidobacteriota bacterium]
MDSRLKPVLKALVLDLRHALEGWTDEAGVWHSGNLADRLAALGIRPDRSPTPVNELPRLTQEDRRARQVVEAFLAARAKAGVGQSDAIDEFVQETAYTWANRLLALRCLEARALIDEVILQKDVYGGRSLQHNRLAKSAPHRCIGEDDGLFAVLFDEFVRRAEELPDLFDPDAAAVTLRPSVAGLKRCVALLSGGQSSKGQEPATDELFMAPDALGWAYQYWNTDEKERVFEIVREKKGTKIEGADIIPATCIYTEPYIVKFLVQNSLGALWMHMRPSSRLSEQWEYYVNDADRTAATPKLLREVTILDPAVGSGHFLLVAFDLLYEMYLEEGEITDPPEICASIVERNLFGIDIDARAVQIAALALYMKAKEKAPDFAPRRLNLVATNIRLPAGKDYLEGFLSRHPEDRRLAPALQGIFQALQHVDEIGSLLRVDEVLDQAFREVKEKTDKSEPLLRGTTDWQVWKAHVLQRLREHFHAEARVPDLSEALFGEAVVRGLSVFDLLSRRYDVVMTNPPYMGSKNMGELLKRYVQRDYAPGKRDLYAAFILRCWEMAADGGVVAMVTQQSWMFLRSFADLRALSREKVLKEFEEEEKFTHLAGLTDEELFREPVVQVRYEGHFKGLLRDTTIETLAHLGEHAFDDPAAAGAFVALFVLANGAPSATHWLTAFRLVGPKSPEEKDSLLRTAIAGSAPQVITRPP